MRGDYTKLNGDCVANFDLDPNSISPARLVFLQGAIGGGPDTNLDDQEMNQFMGADLTDVNWGVSSTASIDVGDSTVRVINSYRASTAGVAATDENVFQFAESIAVYGQANIYLADELTLTLGGRWT